MRKVSLVMNMSLDGYVARPNGEVDWIYPHFTPTQMEMVTTTMRDADTLVMGRVNYLSQAEYWPTQTSELAKLLNSHKKVVFSKTLSKLEWNNSRLANAEAAEEMAALKAQPGKAIVVTGGSTCAQSILRTGLVDEIWLIIHPVILGGGIPYFSSLPETLQLKLVSNRAFETGSVSLVYKKADL